MGKRMGGKRGAPFGNRNSVKHGRFTASALAARRRDRVRREEAMLIETLANALTRLVRAERAGVDIARFGFLLAEDPRGGTPPVCEVRIGG